MFTSCEKTDNALHNRWISASFARFRDYRSSLLCFTWYFYGPTYVKLLFERYPGHCSEIIYLLASISNNWKEGKDIFTLQLYRLVQKYIQCPALLMKLYVYELYLKFFTSKEIWRLFIIIDMYLCFNGGIIDFSTFTSSERSLLPTLPNRESLTQNTPFKSLLFRLAPESHLAHFGKDASLAFIICSISIGTNWMHAYIGFKDKYYIVCLSSLKSVLGCRMTSVSLHPCNDKQMLFAVWETFLPKLALSVFGWKRFLVTISRFR